MLVTWTPVKNTEREAQRKHGDTWRELRAPWSTNMANAGPHDRRLITSMDESDLRWINASQVTDEVSVDEPEPASETEGECVEIVTEG
jgi:hypothetical protein